MRLAGVALFVALVAGSASAQIVLKPIKPKPDTVQATEDPIRLPPNEVGAPLGRTISQLPGETTSEADKEARQNRDLAKGQKAAAMAAKSAKLAQDNAAIASQVAEAKDKADKAKNAAGIELKTGIVSGAIQAGAGAQSTGPQQTNGDGKPKSAAKPCKDCDPPAKPH